MKTQILFMNRLFFLALIVILSSCGTARLKFRKAEPREIVTVETHTAEKKNTTPLVTVEEVSHQEEVDESVVVVTDNIVEINYPIAVQENPPLVELEPLSPEDTVYLEADSDEYKVQEALRTEKRSGLALMFSVFFWIFMAISVLIGLFLFWEIPIIAGLVLALSSYVAGWIHFALGKKSRYSTAKAERQLNGALVVLILATLLIGFILFDGFF